jgi:hypothetical protein
MSVSFYQIKHWFQETKLLNTIESTTCVSRLDVCIHIHSQLFNLVFFLLNIV